MSGSIDPSLQAPGFLVHATARLLRAAGRPIQRSFSVPVDSGAAAVAHDEGPSLSMSWQEFDDALLSTAESEPHVGLWLGEQLSEANLHLFGPMIVASRTMREAEAHARVVQRSWFRRPAWEFEETPPTARVIFTEIRGHFGDDMVLSLAFHVGRRFLGPPHSDEFLAEFARPAPADPTPYLKCFRGRVRFDAPANALSYPSRLLDIVRPGTDAAVASALRGMALSHLAAQMPLETWSGRVERAIREYSSLAQVNLEEVARLCGTTARTLRRQLADEDQRFSDLLNQVRFERATEFLARTDVPLRELAEALGYADGSSFQRAFRRWAGQSALEYRERARRLASAESERDDSDSHPTGR